MGRYLITATLLNNWKYYQKSEATTKDDFLKTLRREPTETTPAMQRGNDFEDWAVKNYKATLNGVYQLRAYRDWDKYLLYGRIDCLKRGVIWDYKCSQNYEVGNYYGSPQTSMYFALVPEAYKFNYLVCKGVFKEDKPLLIESYLRDEVKPIQQTIFEFETWLKEVGLWQVYTQYWGALK